MKRILNFKSLLLLLTAFTSFNVSGQDIFEVDNIRYYSDITTPNIASVIDNPYSGNVVIPDSVTYNGTIYYVTSIGTSAFGTCSGLTSITIPSSVTSIGTSAFYACTGLTSITIPNSVTSIGDYCFSYCSNLTSVNISSGVTSIPISTFDSCASLTSIIVPNGVTSIGERAFADCRSLNFITLPSSVTSIDQNAFSGCRSLTSLVIPSEVTVIKDFVFNNCAKLTSIVIPEGVTSVGISAFDSCCVLNSITIPSSVTSIGNDAFSDCSGLTLITSLNAQPPIAVANTFFNIDFNNCIIKVPVGSKQNYTNAEGWNQFANIIELTMVGVENAVTNPLKVYKEEGLIVIKGAAYGETIKVYTVSGMQIYSTQVKDKIVKLKLSKNQIYIVNIGQTSYKVVL